MTHASLSASSAHRWMECPGSVALSANIVRETNVYAEEGTAAHRVAERCLNERVNAKTFIGKTVIRSRVTNEFIVCDKDMVEAVQVYLDHIRETVASLPSATVAVEHKFQLDWLIPDKLWGTNDCNIFQPYGKMVVNDYKHGKGVAVAAEDNVQLMYYGLGALGETNPYCIEEVEIVIVQPRTPGEAVKRWAVKPEALYAWGKDVLLPAAKRALAPDAPLHAGDHCRFCPALAVCPEVRAHALAVTGIPFSPVEMPTKEAIVLPAPDTLPTPKLEQIVEVADIIAEWSTAVAATLKARLEAGEVGERYKLVAGRSTRKWIDENAAAESLKAYIDPYERSLVTPKGAEDKMKDRNMDKKAREAVVASLVEVTRGRSLAPIGDKREALTINSPFNVLEAQTN